jgi:hypothetical protein
MLHFRKDRWQGNRWASIDIQPVDAAYFSRLLTHLSSHYSFVLPLIIDLIDGYAADFVLLGSKATIHIDTWTFSIAFEEEGVRDQVLIDLQELPPGYFEIGQDTI